MIKEQKIGIIGLGYVGLPLAVEFGKILPTIGFDINEQRIKELQQGKDQTLEVEPEELQQANQLQFSSDQSELQHCNIYVVTVPTPIDDSNRPNLGPLLKASETVGNVIAKGDIVIYESTVYPGATEDECVPIIEAVSGLKFNQDFFAGYSPERINPGDKLHRLPSIVKVTSGSTPKVAKAIDELYAKIITAGTYSAESIRVAEAAKVIENTQRDLNIALINELAMIFNRMEIDTHAVLEAAGTKWNFLPFRPGLVGGHCIGVDPYYLTHKAEQIGHNPEIILSGRRVNDAMGSYVAQQLIKKMVKRGIAVLGARVLVMGLTFKENCPDLRNTKVVDVISELEEYGVQVDVYDPWVDSAEAEAEYGIGTIVQPEAGAYDGIIVSVAHQQFKELSTSSYKDLGKSQHVIYDLKYVLPREFSDIRL